ncbi:MAG: NAD-dependent epimerase/dehydratase family protein [Acetobacteraceae bacterium]
MDDVEPKITILGASGLIGHAVASELKRAGLPLTAVARRFTPAQRNTLAGSLRECPIASLDAGALRELFEDLQTDIVLNCIGILQDGGHERTADVHHRFVARLIEALDARPGGRLLVHLSIPGNATEDETAFSRTKREAERLIAAAGVDYAILRPGFVVAPAAYGGSALLRALAALPVDLPGRESARPFAATDVGDIAHTIGLIVSRWRSGERQWAVVWDIMERHPSTVGGVVDAFRRRFGGPNVIGHLPGWLMNVAARAGDVSAHLGWRPPIRSTALRELRRGVNGDPNAWIEATGIEPAPLEAILAGLPATVQEQWFARLYLIKPLVLGSLSVLWCLSGLIAVTVAFDAAVSILTSHGIPPGLAHIVTVLAGLCDIFVGAAIAVRRTCGFALFAGLSLFVVLFGRRESDCTRSVAYAARPTPEDYSTACSYACGLGGPGQPINRNRAVPSPSSLRPHARQQRRDEHQNSEQRAAQADQQQIVCGPAARWSRLRSCVPDSHHGGGLHRRAGAVTSTADLTLFGHFHAGRHVKPHGSSAGRVRGL